MADKKKKISELPLIKSLIGLYTIGVDAANNSGKVSLEWLQNAYENVLTAITNANKATTIANTAADIANKAATNADSRMVQISEEANQIIEETNTAKNAAITATANAKSVSDHPGYIGPDYYVYTWDYVTGTYNKTDTILRPEGFSIYRTYSSIAAMNADLNNVPEGKFVLINTGSVEDEDTAKLYVRGASSFEYLVDMSGAIGFTGKTPQITIGNVTVGSSPSASLSPNGTDEAGNPMFKLNIVIVAGPQGLTPVIESGKVTTGQPGTVASADLVPNGQTEDGRDKYLLNLTIPQGIPGTGSGNVSVTGTGLVTGKKYLFVPGANGSTVGTFVEYVAPTIPTKTSDLENDKDFTTSNAVTELLLGYVQKVAGKGLSTEDFTTELKNKLSALSNYDDTDIQAAVTSLQTQLNTLLSGNASTAIESFNEIIAFLANVEDTQTLAGIIAGINTAIADVQASIPTKYSQLQNDNNTVQDANYVHTDNNYTTTDKDKLSGIQAGAQVNPGIATPSANGLMSAGDKTILDRQESYTTASTVASLNPAYRYIYVTLSSNASLSVSGTGTSYNGRSITAYVYCSSARTIAIPTTGSYVSMCGSSYTCPAGKWVEFNLECINGIWHIAKLEQE